MRNFKFLLFSRLTLLALDNKQKVSNKEFIYSPVSLCVFNNYAIKFNTSLFFSEDEFAHVRYWVMIMNGVLDRKLISFLTRYSFILIRDYLLMDEENKNKNTKEINKKYQKENNILKLKIERLMTNVNYDGIENIQEKTKLINQDNWILHYEIVPLRSLDKDQMDNLKDEMNQINPEDLTAKYGFFPNIQKNKHKKRILDKCNGCDKNEIKQILNSMEVNKSEIVYLNSRSRYVYIKLLKKEVFSQISSDIVTYLYIKYGMSLLKNNKTAQEEYFSKIVHDFFCK